MSVFDDLKELGEFLVVVVNFRGIDYGRWRRGEISDNPLPSSLRLTHISKGFRDSLPPFDRYSQPLPNSYAIAPCAYMSFRHKSRSYWSFAHKRVERGVGSSRGEWLCTEKEINKISYQTRIGQMRKRTALAGCVKSLRVRA